MFPTPSAQQPKAGSGNPKWETVAILLAIAAIWPAMLRYGMEDSGIPWWLAWGLLAVALVVMVVVFVRRIRRLRHLAQRGPDDQSPSFPGAPR